MTSLPPGLIETIETGDIVLYRDSAGRGLTLSDVIRAKKTGTWETIRPGLTQPYRSLPGVSYRLQTPSLSQPKVTAQAFEGALANNNIPHIPNTSADHGPTLAPLENPTVQQLYADTLSSDSFVKCTIGDTPPEDLPDFLERLFPQGLPKLDGTNTTVLSFNQAPRNVTANKTLYAATRNVTMQIAQSEPDSPLVTDMTVLLNEIQEIAQTHFFGTGSPIGQIGRLKKGFQILEDANKNRTDTRAWQDATDYKTFAKTLDRTRPIVTAQIDGNIDIQPIGLLCDPRLTLSNPATGDTTEINLVHITKTADAGFPWLNNLNKGDSIVGDILILQAIYERTASITNPEDLAKLFQHLAWSRYHKLKAKAEIYELDKFSSKIRNISVPPNCIMILPQMVFKIAKWYTSTYGRPFKTEAANLSLMNYAPFHGGHDRLITSIMASPKRSVLHYADNLYIFERGKFASIDVSSMEALHTHTTVKNSLRYILERCFACEFDENGQLKAGGLLGNTISWLTYEWFGNAVCHSPGVIRSQVVQVPGLPSGFPGTFEFNDMLMSQLADKINRTPQPINTIDPDGLPNALTKRHAKSLGFTIKTEFAAPATTATLDRAKLQPWEPINEKGRISSTDMLGFDTIFVQTEDLLVPVAVLNRDRLMKALTFSKSDLRAVPLGPASETIIQLATLNILYLSGGWAHQPIATAIEVTTRTLMAELNLSEAVTATRDQAAAQAIITVSLARAAATINAEGLIDESMARGLLRAMLGSGLIPLTEVMRIIHSPELADQMDHLVVSNLLFIGPKALRMLGPVRIAELSNDPRLTGLEWARPVLDVALSSLAKLQDVTEPPTAPTQPATDTTTQPPPPEQVPETSQQRPPKRAHPPAMPTSVVRELLPPATANNPPLSQVLDIIHEIWSSTGDTYEVPSPPDDEKETARVLAHIFNAVDDDPAKNTATIGLLETIGAIEPKLTKTKRV